MVESHANLWRIVSLELLAYGWTLGQIECENSGRTNGGWRGLCELFCCSFEFFVPCSFLFFFCLFAVLKLFSFPVSLLVWCQIHSLFPHNAVFWWVLFADVNVTCWQGAPPKSPEPMPVDKGEPKEDEVKKLSDAWAATCTKMFFLNLSVVLVILRTLHFSIEGKVIDW